MFEAANIPYQDLVLADRTIAVKRIDLVHPLISGNKFFKLKYNLQTAKAQQKHTLLSFGGAYSNHIHALAYAAREYGFQSIGFIRGEELATQTLNPTLQDACDAGMRLHFLSRSAYRQKQTPEFLEQLTDQFPNAYILPEGGSNALAIQGCEEIISAHDQQVYDVIVCAVGTGATLAGIINASHPRQQVFGFAAINHDYVRHEIEQWTQKRNWKLWVDDEFGGYGRIGPRLLAFIEDLSPQLSLEPLYTGKALYRLQQLLQCNAISTEQRVLFIHSGGLQGYRASSR